MDSETLTILFTQPKHLGTFSPGRMLDTSLPSIFSSGFIEDCALAAIRTLVTPLTITYIEDLDAWRHVIQSAVNLRNLTIQTANVVEAVHPPLHDTDTLPGQLLLRLFSHILQDEQEPKLKLDLL